MFSLNIQKHLSYFKMTTCPRVFCYYDSNGFKLPLLLKRKKLIFTHANCSLHSQYKIHKRNFYFCLYHPLKMKTTINHKFCIFYYIPVPKKNII